MATFAAAVDKGFFFEADDALRSSHSKFPGNTNYNLTHYTLPGEHPYPDWVYAKAAATAWPDTNNPAAVPLGCFTQAPTQANLDPSIPEVLGQDEPYPDWVYAAAAAAWPDPLQYEADGGLMPLEAAAEILPSNQNEAAVGSQDLKNSAGNTSARLKCTIDGCTADFKSKNDLRRHTDTVHSDGQLLECPFAGCPRVGRDGFKRRDNLIQHRRPVHGEDIKKVKYRFGESA